MRIRHSDSRSSHPCLQCVCESPLWRPGVTCLYFSVVAPRSSVLSLSFRPVLKRFCHAACLCMGKKQCWTSKKGEGGLQTVAFHPLCICCKTCCIESLGFNKQCLKIHVVASYPESYVQSCVYRTAALETFSIVICDFYIRAVS